MTAKQYLSQISRLNKMIANKLTEIYQLKSIASNISVLNEADKVQTSGSKDRIGDMVSEIVDLEKEAKEYIDIYTDLRRKIIVQIDAMPNENYYKVLFAKYIEEKTFEVIAEEMEYSWRQIIRIHGDALAEFERIYGSEFVSFNVILNQCYSIS